MQKQKTVLCIQDLCCVGRCSLAVVIPALAAAGVQPCALPTALLSTHTGGFGKPACTEESDLIRAALDHFEALNPAFSCVYSGYLAGAGQIDLVRRAFMQNPGALKIVDPVMADHGKPYASMTPDIRAAIAQLCREADLIVPNITEAALLLGIDPAERTYCTAEVEQNSAQLLELYPNLTGAVITGVCREDGQCGNVCIRRNGSVQFLRYEPVPQAYPGTGDLFAAVLTGALLRDVSLEQACGIAADFVAAAARATLEGGCDPRFGVHFEPLLGQLAQKLNP